MLSYQANQKLVEAGFAGIMHLAVLEGLKKEKWELEGIPITIPFHGETLQTEQKRAVIPQISFAFEGGWDLNYPETAEMRTYSTPETLMLDVKYGSRAKLTPVEERFCLEVIRLWKLCEKALLAPKTPLFHEGVLKGAEAMLHERNKWGFKSRLDTWTDEDYKNGALLVLVLAEAVGVDWRKLARAIRTAYENPFHKFPYVEAKRK